MSDTRAKDSIVVWQLTTIFRDIIFSRKYGMWKGISQGNVGYWEGRTEHEMLLHKRVG